MNCTLKTQLRFAAAGAASLWVAGCASPNGATGQNAPNFGAFYKAMQQRNAAPMTLETPRQAPSVFIDVAAIAARHPAWRLANALEKRSDKTLRFSGLSAPQSPQAVEIRSAPLPRAAMAPPRAPSETENGALGGEVPAYSRPPQRLGAREAVPLEKSAQRIQEAAFGGFLGDVAERQQVARDEERALWRTELEDEIEAAQRLSLKGLQPLLPPPDVQLEMTNLRLKLLTNLRSTLLDNSPLPESERLAARTRLRALEAEWRDKLRVQENARLEELKKTQFEMPQKMRSEGEISITKRLQSQAGQDAALRETASTALRERIAAGFASDGSAEDGVLSIRLPAASLAAQSVESSSRQTGALAWLQSGGITHQSNNGIFSTNGPFMSSAGAFSGNSPTSMQRVGPVQNAPHALNRAQALRQQAWQEAGRWAQAIARRQGWTLKKQRTAGALDRTAEALRLLNLS